MKTTTIRYNSAYGDAKFHSYNAASDYYFRCNGGVAMLMFDKYYLVTSNRRASQFEKQGDCVLIKPNFR